MRRTLRTLAVAGIVTLASGCALQDTRYDYARSSPFRDYDESILDWNFPTTTSQGPLLPPERLTPVRPAIGVPWGTSSAFTPTPQASVGDAPLAVAAEAHDADAPCDGCVAALAGPEVPGDAAGDRLRDPVLHAAR